MCGLELKMVDTSAIGARLNRAILFEKFMESLAGGKSQIVTTAEVAACKVLEQLLQRRPSASSLPSLTIVSNGGASAVSILRATRAGCPSVASCGATPTNRVQSMTQFLGSFLFAVKSTAATGKLEQ